MGRKDRRWWTKTYEMGCIRIQVSATPSTQKMDKQATRYGETEFIAQRNGEKGSGTVWGERERGQSLN